MKGSISTGTLVISIISIVALIVGLAGATAWLKKEKPGVDEAKCTDSRVRYCWFVQNNIPLTSDIKNNVKEYCDRDDTTLPDADECNRILINP